MPYTAPVYKSGSKATKVKKGDTSTDEEGTEYESLGDLGEDDNAEKTGPEYRLMPGEEEKQKLDKGKRMELWRKKREVPTS